MPHGIAKTNYLNRVARMGALKQQLLGLIQEEFLDDLNHHTTGFNGITPKQIVFHLTTEYASITPAMMKKNLTSFREPVDLSTSIGTWIKKMYATLSKVCTRRWQSDH